MPLTFKEIIYNIYFQALAVDFHLSRSFAPASKSVNWSTHYTPIAQIGLPLHWRLSCPDCSLLHCLSLYCCTVHTHGCVHSDNRFPSPLPLIPVPHMSSPHNAIFELLHHMRDFIVSVERAISVVNLMIVEFSFGHIFIPFCCFCSRL